MLFLLYRIHCNQVQIVLVRGLWELCKLQDLEDLEGLVTEYVSVGVEWEVKGRKNVSLRSSDADRVRELKTNSLVATFNI